MSASRYLSGRRDRTTSSPSLSRSIGASSFSRGPSRYGSGGSVSRQRAPRPVTPLPAAPKPKNMSLFEQLDPRRLAGMAAQGVSEFTKALASTPGNVVRMQVDSLRNAGVPIPGESKEMDFSGNLFQDFQAYQRTYNPMLADIGTSLLGTVNVTGIGSQENIIGRYQRAVDEGRWVDEFIEDAGNVAIVAGGVSAAAGRVAGASATPASASRLLRRGRDVADTPVTARSLSSAVDDAVAVPPRLPPVREVPLRLPGQETRAVRLTDAMPGKPDVTFYKGRGLAGRLERSAAPDLSPAELFAKGAPQSALAVDRVGRAAGRVSLGAQFFDPADSLVFAAEKVASKGAGGLARVAAKRLDSPEATATRLSKAQRRLERARRESRLRQDTDAARVEIQQQAERFQVTVDQSLARLGIDQARRDLIGGIVADATDLEIDAFADVWKLTPAADRATVLKAWNADRPTWAQLTPERLDLYNDYRDGLLTPEVTAVLAEGIDQLRRSELNRRQMQLNAGNLAPEQLNEPMVRVDQGGREVLVPYSAVDARTLADAIANDRVEYPWLESKTGPELAAREANVEKRRAELDEAQAALDAQARRVDAVVAQRTATPRPGRNVPWDDTPEGRAQLLAENAERLRELEDRAELSLTGAANEVVQESIAEALLANLDEVDLPDPRVGTNPTPSGQWSQPRGTWDVGVQRRADVVEQGHPGNAAQISRPDAEKVIVQETIERRKLQDAADDVWKAERALEKAEVRANDFIDQLNDTQQSMISDVAAKGITAFRRAARSIAGGTDIGGLRVSRDGTYSLTGLTAKLARDAGVYDVVVEASVRLRERMYRSDYEALDLQRRKTMTFDQYADTRARYGPSEVTNVAVNQLIARLETLPDWDLRRGQIEQALVAQDLDNYLRQFYRQDSLMKAHAAYQALRARIEHMPENMRRHVGQEFYDSINTEYGAYIKRFHDELSASVNRNMSYVPARFRTPLQEARRMVSNMMRLADEEWSKGTPESQAVAMAYSRMVEQAPTSMAMYVEANKAVPIHLIGGDGSGRGRRARTDGSSGVNTPDPRGKHERQQGMRVPTLREYAALEARELTNIASQQSVLAMANDPTFSRSAAQVPGLTEALREFAANNDRPMTFREFEELLREVDPDENWAVVKRATPDATPGVDGRYDPLVFNDPSRADTMIAPGERANQIVVTDPMTGEPIMRNFDEVDTLNRLPDVRVVPDYVATVLDDFLNPRSGKWLTMYDQITQLWKTTTLAWSVAWVTYNAVGNLLMASFSYGQSPIQLYRNAKIIRNELARMNQAAGFEGRTLATAAKFDTMSALVPARMGAHGASWAERMSTMQLSDDVTRLGRVIDYVSQPDRSWIGKVTEFSYTVNEFTDNFFRTTVLMDDLHRRLQKEAPIKAEWLNADGTLRDDLTPAEHAELTNVSAKANEALDRSVRAALNTMGDFTRLTRLERRFVKRVFPFYPWLRHQTAMAFRIPMQNPLRWMWMQSLADMLSEEGSDTAVGDLMSSMWEAPWGMVNLAPANPLAGGVTALGSDTDGFAAFDPQSALSAVNPMIKLGASQIAGKDLGGVGDVSRPPDQKATNRFGQEVGGSTLSRLTDGDLRGALGEFGYSVAGQIPMARGLRDAALGPAPRYDSGDEIVYADDRYGGRWLPLARAARVPFLPNDITYLREVAEDKDREERRRRRRASIANALESRG